MFTLDTFVRNAKDIPSDWIFEHYLGLPEKLTGQRIQMKSIFNKNDRDPSMYLYYDEKRKKYRFKCFSSGNSGDGLDLMMLMWECSFSDAHFKVIKDYDDYLVTGNTIEKKEYTNIKWMVTNFEFGKWTQYDANYWVKYNISSDILERYNVKPLKSYVMTKVINNINTTESFIISKQGLYAYMTNDNVVYKIYQPDSNTKKFLKVSCYMQGSQQLENKRFLLITSSLKDCMALKSLSKLNIDVIAPDSETAKLSPECIEEYKNKYEAVVTYMDSDVTGIKSMQYYLEKYNLPFCYVPLEKDFSDIVKIHGITKAAHIFIPILDKAIEKYKLLNNEQLELSN